MRPTPHDQPAPGPGFLALHGDCAETLAQALIDWSSAHPLGPLEQEVVLVQSNGTAESVQDAASPAPRHLRGHAGGAARAVFVAQLAADFGAAARAQPLAAG